MTLPQETPLYGKAGSIIVVGLTLLISPGLVAHADSMASSPMVEESQSDSRPVVVDAGVESGDRSQAKVRNKRPVANAGKDQKVYAQATVSLSGAESKDSDGKIVKYLWKQIGGQKVKLVGATQTNVSFKAPVVTKVTKLKFLLTVTDNKKATAKDTVLVTVAPIPNKSPVANAGKDQKVYAKVSVSLSGAKSKDPDGKIVKYRWKQIGGQRVNLVGATQAKVIFNAPSVAEATQLKFLLTVTDNKKATANDAVLVTVRPLPVAGQLNDTGITLCGSGLGNDHDCNLLTDGQGHPIPPSVRTQGTGQDGHVGRDVTHNDGSDGHAGFSFTKLDANGDALFADATEWHCVKDNVTGLVWEIKQGEPNNQTGDSGLHDPDDRYYWYEPDSSKNGGSSGYQSKNYALCHGYIEGDSATYCNTKAYVDRVNKEGWCGANDWRLPTRAELFSIVNYQHYDPTIDDNWFPGTQSSGFWSASPSARADYYAWFISFSDGRSDEGFKRDHAYVRLVRGEQ